MQKKGIIKSAKESTLEMFRAYSVIPGYVTCIKRKQEVIRKVVKELKLFSMDSLRTGSVSIMLTADPGGGKTFLAKKLSEIFNFTFLHFDITQMIHRDDLLDLFDRVANEQAKSNRLVLIYVDEINALLDGHPIYSAFLSPMEDHTYVRHEGAFSLQPCAWLFTGTVEDNQVINSTDKLPDFESRLTIKERMDYGFFRSQCNRIEDNPKELEETARLEQVYLGASLINYRFPSVQQISEDVLKLFYDIEPDKAPARKIRQWVDSLENVTDNITLNNSKERRQITKDSPEVDDSGPVKIDFSS